MQIHVTDAAKHTLLQAMDANPEKKAQLRYDAEGCGCAVSGVPAIWLADELTGQCERIETNGLPLYIQTSQKVFFDEEMTIDYNEKAKTLVLKSPAEILSPRMSILVKQGETESESKAESH
ncbi:iron-sulfur cluster biosynthesis family protein [Bacillus siamensis]|uniref:iron-sulfur cluster biosynthesis family protein n=1 Tax=Bacillus siamensis TaxID=659243 RepID=UPI0003707EC4|nr:iron-sulfur cluster biosynthesis family protein [Bacillus siamensis]